MPAPGERATARRRDRRRGDIGKKTRWGWRGEGENPKRSTAQGGEAGASPEAEALPVAGWCRLGSPAAYSSRRPSVGLSAIRRILSDRSRRARRAVSASPRAPRSGRLAAARPCRHPAATGARAAGARRDGSAALGARALGACAANGLV